MNNQNQGYPNYGQPNNMNAPQPNPGYPQQPIMNNPGNKKSNKGMFIIIGVIIAVAVIAVACILMFGNKKTESNGKRKNRPEPSMERTIMIYMVGSDLEDQNGLASYELSHINPANIDLKNNNVIMITGGSKKWFSEYIDAEETAVFQLKENGFEKVNTGSAKNMGDVQTLSKFLTDVYNDYPSKKYELIFWNHGMGALGLESDSLNGDLLTLVELEQALEKSPFDKDEKLDSILFINCLLGNIQLAGVIDDYAKYMIASEEISYSSPTIDKFKFLEDIEVSDTGYEFGKKFIDNLVNNTPIVQVAYYKNTPTTYSVVDLSKVSQLESSLNSFIQSININQSFSTLSIARSSLFQYGIMEPAYDMVDLHTFVSAVQNLAPTEANKVLEAINSAVVYNYSNDVNSKGISTYFPYQSDKEYVDVHLKLLSSLKNASSNNYLTFLQNFDLYRRTNSSYFMDVSTNQINTVGNDYSMQFSDAQKKNFASASYMIFKQTADGKFIPVYFSDNTTLDGNGKLKANFDGKILTVLNPSTNVREPIVAYEQKNGNYTTDAVVEAADGKKANVEAVISFQNGTGKVVSIIEKAEGSNEGISLPSMVFLTLESYQTISFVNYDYQITDGKGLIMDKWQEGNEHSINALVKSYKLEKTALNKNEKYYFAFKVRDLSNEVTYSQLVPIK